MGTITPAQRKQLKSLALDTRANVERTRDDLKRAHADLFKIYGSYSLDEHAAKAAIDRASKAQLDLLNIHLDNQVGLRRVLSSDQFAEFWSRVNQRAGKPGMGLLGMHDDAFWDHAPDREVLDTLGLASDQIKQLKQPKLDQQRNKAVDKLRQDSRQLIDLYSNYDLDANTARKLVDSIHSDQRTLAELNHKRQQNLRSVLTESQFGKLMDETAKHAPHHEHEHGKQFGRH
jgi:Spy/CpxP family protein refolding chaperone